MSKQIAVYEKKIVPLVEEAKVHEIVNDVSMVEAVQILSRMNKIIDKVKEEKEKVTKPLNQALKAERERWSPVESIYEEGIEVLREKMSVYQTEQVRIQKQEADRIASRVGEGKGKLKVETAVKKIAELPVAQKEIATNIGLVQFRETKVLKITDINLIPDRYWIIDEKAILNDLKAGIEVAGATVETIQTPVNYR